MLREEPTPVADHDGVDPQVELVDEVALEQPAEQLAAAVDLELAPGLRLELAHRRLDVAVDDVGVLPGRVLERGRGHVLGQDVDAVGDRIAPVVVRPVRLPKISQVLRPSSNASARSNIETRNGQPSSSAYAAVHPPRSNPPRRSSSGPPGPWYTPSRVSIIDAVSFMVIAPSLGSMMTPGPPCNAGGSRLHGLGIAAAGRAEYGRRMIGTEPVELRALVERLDDLAARRLASQPAHRVAARARARQLADLLRGHIRVRAASLDAPLVVLLVGPTGAGKSTIFNTIAGRRGQPDRASSGRPRGSPSSWSIRTIAQALVEGAFAGDPAGPAAVRRGRHASSPGLAVVDAPDIDSLEHANRALADRLVEAADLCCFVTTATRYADRVPWAVLSRVQERGLPLLVVVNRMPPDPADRAEILADVRRLVAEAGLNDLLAATANGRPASSSSVREGDLASDGDRLEPHSIAAAPSTRSHGCAPAGDARRELASRALTGSLLGLGDSLDRIADDAEHEAIDVEALRRTADRAYEQD